MDLIITIIDDLGGIYQCHGSNPPGITDHTVQEDILPHTNQDSVGGG